jgi:hypothetical protein
VRSAPEVGHFWGIAFIPSPERGVMATMQKERLRPPPEAERRELVALVAASSERADRLPATFCLQGAMPSSFLRSMTTWTCERVRHWEREPIGLFSISGRTFSQTKTGPGSLRMPSTLPAKESTSS